MIKLQVKFSFASGKTEMSRDDIFLVKFTTCKSEITGLTCDAWNTVFDAKETTQKHQK